MTLTPASLAAFTCGSIVAGIDAGNQIDNVVFIPDREFHTLNPLAWLALIFPFLHLQARFPLPAAFSRSIMPFRNGLVLVLGMDSCFFRCRAFLGVESLPRRLIPALRVDRELWGRLRETV